MIKQLDDQEPLPFRQRIRASSCFQSTSFATVLNHAFTVGSLPSTNSAQNWIRVEVVARTTRDCNLQVIGCAIFTVARQLHLTVTEIVLAFPSLRATWVQKLSRSFVSRSADATPVGSPERGAQLWRELREWLGFAASRAATFRRIGTESIPSWSFCGPAFSTAFVRAGRTVGAKVRNSFVSARPREYPDWFPLTTSPTRLVVRLILHSDAPKFGMPAPGVRSMRGRLVFGFYFAGGCATMTNFQTGL